MPSQKPAERPVLRVAPDLAYLGDDGGEPHIDGVPARDLTAADLGRLSTDPAALADVLIKSGIYAAKE
jgi:hypothetical protein